MKYLFNLIALIIISTLVRADDEAKVETEPDNKYKVCSQIGIEDNAILNHCGYCTEGDTGLDANYGLDCNNVCDGDSYLDCNNVCNGNSYIDPCTGICINPSKNETTGGNRDCRGLCSSPQINSSQYLLDECGYCLRENTSQSLLNCSLKCSPFDHENSLICGQCVDINDSDILSQVLNVCGHCRTNDTTGCSCDEDPSLCGCSDSDNCYYVSDFSPKAVPNNQELSIQVFGYFNGPVNSFYCNFSHEINGTDFLFSATVENNTVVECIVNLTEDISGRETNFFNNLPKVGRYVFALQSHETTALSNVFDNSNSFVVYNRDLAIFSYMSPTRIFTTNHTKAITLSFVGDSQSNPALYKIPIKCIITYNDMEEFVVINGDNWFTCTVPASISHSHSQNITVIPTFDGMHSLANQSSYTLTIVAPHPQILEDNSFISEDGLNIVIFFERSVHASINVKKDSRESCDFLFTNQTISQLEKYNLVYCQWLTSIQLLILLSLPIVEQSIRISFNEGTIKESAQQIALHNMQPIEVIVNKRNSNVNHLNYENRIALIGPTLMPTCGTFTLNGYFSSAKGSKGVKFKWSVSSLPPRHDLISEQLLKLISSNNKSSIILEASAFSSEPYSYKFVLSAQLADGSVIEASHQIFKYNYYLPVVTIFPTTLLASGPLTLDQSATLYTEVSIPECIENPEPIIYEWKTNNPKIKFDMLHMSKTYYEISEYNLVNERIKLEVHIFMGNRTTHASIASLTLYPLLPHQIAYISNGISMLSIGKETGQLQLTAHVSKVQRDRINGYQWSCHYSDSEEPCFSNTNNKKLLISRQMQNRPELMLDSNMFTKSKHRIGLHVLYRNDLNTTFYNIYTNVNINDGNAPQVLMGPVYLKYKLKLISSTTSSNGILVPSHTPLIVKGIVNNRGSIKSIEWFLSNSIFQLQWNNKFINNQIHTELHLHRDQIFPYGSYNFTLKACNSNGLCSEVNKLLIASQVVSECNIIVEPSVQSNMVTVTTDRCNVPPDRSPLTYQLYLIKDKIFIPISRAQFSSVIIYHSSKTMINGSKFAVEVCDNYEFCQMFNATNENVIEADYNENINESINYLLNKSKRYLSSGDPVSALAILISPLLNQSFTENKIIHSLIGNYSVKISSENIRNKGDLNIICYVFGQLLRQTNDFYLKNTVIQVLKNISQTTKIVPDLQTLDFFYTNLLNFYKFEEFIYKQFNATYGYYAKINETQSYLSKIRHIFLYILRSAAQQIPIGKYIRFGDKVEFGEAVTIITHQKRFYEIKLETKLNYWKNVSTIVKFNEKTIFKYIDHIFNKSSNAIYNSMVYAITLFPDKSPYQFDDRAHKLTPIVDITIHSPIDGHKVEVAAEKHDYIAIMKVTLTGNQTFGDSEYTTRCHYYSENKEKWDTEGITELGISGSNGGCLMYHLSSFVILRVTQQISTDYIFGVIVAVSMGILIFGIMTVFFVQKKNDTSTRVTPISYRR